MHPSYPLCRQGDTEFVISTDTELREESHFPDPRFPVSVYIQNFRHAASDAVPLHWHAELQLSWVFEGELACTLQGRPQRLKRDQLLLVLPHQLHSSHTVGGDVKTLCMSFTPDIFHPLIRERYIMPLLLHPGFSGAVLHAEPHEQTLLQKLLHPGAAIDYFTVLNLLSLVMERLQRDLDTSADLPDPEETRIFQAMLSYVHGHFQCPLTAREIAAAGPVNKNRCNALFRKYTGQTPIHYLNEYRLHQAKNLILHSAYSISEISERVGYNQLSYFIQQFGAQYGMPPLRYRNQFKKP